MPTNIEVLKSIKKYTENLQEGELPEWIAPLFMDQPSPEYDTPEESAFDTALQELDNQNLDPNNPSAALSATLGAAKTHNVNPNQVVDRAQFRGTLRDIAKNVSLAIAVGIKADPERDKREQNTRTALSTLTPEVIGLAQAAKPEPNFPSLSDDAAAEAAAAAAAQQAATTGMGKAFGQMEGSQESQGTASAGTGSGRGGTGSSGSLSGGYDGPDSGADSSDAPSGADAAADAASGIRDGGRIGALIQHLQTGGDVENADTNMEVANVPMGVVDDPDGAPGPFSGGTGVEDDLDMDVEAGSYVLNAESVQLIGISDINEVIRDAYAIAAALGKPMPQDYDPQNKVPIRISNGEAVIPKSLVDIIGLDKLEKWNQKGLQLRKQKEEFMAQQQQAQPPQGPQVAAEAPMQQQMGQLMNKGGQPYHNILSGKDETIEETIKGIGEQAEKVESFLGIGSSSPEEIQGTSYKVGERYKKRDIEGAINAVSKVLGKSEVQKNTKLFLTEIANAESSFGRDKTTNKKESNIVGPWQVGMGDNQAYQEILRRLNPNSGVYRPKLQENLDKFIATSWGKEIDWLNLSKKDMMNPLINATIARLYISTMDEDAIPADKTKRAELWARIYNTPDDPEGTADYYLSKNLKMP